MIILGVSQSSSATKNHNHMLSLKSQKEELGIRFFLKFAFVLKATSPGVWPQKRRRESGLYQLEVGEKIFDFLGSTKGGGSLPHSTRAVAAGRLTDGERSNSSNSSNGCCCCNAEKRSQTHSRAELVGRWVRESLFAPPSLPSSLPSCSATLLCWDGASFVSNWDPLIDAQ